MHTNTPKSRGSVKHELILKQVVKAVVSYMGRSFTLLARLLKRTCHLNSF